MLLNSHIQEKLARVRPLGLHRRHRRPNQDTVDRHLGRLRDSGFVGYDSDAVKNPPGTRLGVD